MIFNNQSKLIGELRKQIKALEEVAQAPQKPAEQRTSKQWRSNTTSAFKNERNEQQQLDMLMRGIKSGSLRSLGRGVIKRFVNCGDPRAEALQTALVSKGYAVRKGSRVKLAA